jgi:hypothetical protein
VVVRHVVARRANRCQRRSRVRRPSRAGELLQPPVGAGGLPASPPASPRFQERTQFEASTTRWRAALQRTRESRRGCSKLQVRAISQEVKVRLVGVSAVAELAGRLGEHAHLNEDLHCASGGGLGGLEQPLDGPGRDDRMPGQELEESEGVSGVLARANMPLSRLILGMYLTSMLDQASGSRSPRSSGYATSLAWRRGAPYSYCFLSTRPSEPSSSSASCCLRPSSSCPTPCSR